MKKTLSIILAVIMVFTSCACMLGVFAAEEPTEQIVCACANCTRVPKGCHCCAACPFLDETYLLGCAKNEDGHFKGSYCCGQCSGIWPCNCDCGCEACANKDDKPTDNYKPIITEDQQDQFIKGFQAIMKKISDVFDMIFNTIFEFLRLGEIFGR